MLASVVDTGALLNVVWVSLAAGVGLSLVFSVTIAGAARASLHRRDGRTAAAMAWSIVASVCALVCAAAVILGVIVMLHK
ncbi:MAG TPA: hypothetical protein VIL72_13255 [Beijerinckiaceae bacterium]|jgi:hypothetical protein